MYKVPSVNYEYLITKGKYSYIRGLITKVKGNDKNYSSSNYT